MLLLKIKDKWRQQAAAVGACTNTTLLLQEEQNLSNCEFWSEKPLRVWRLGAWGSRASQPVSGRCTSATVLGTCHSTGGNQSLAAVPHENARWHPPLFTQTKHVCNKAREPTTQGTGHHRQRRLFCPCLPSVGRAWERAQLRDLPQIHGDFGDASTGTFQIGSPTLLSAGTHFPNLCKYKNCNCCFIHNEQGCSCRTNYRPGATVFTHQFPRWNL